MSSRRLPHKVLKKINNKSMLDLLIDRILLVFKKKNVIIATSRNKEDTKIKNYCSKRKIKCYRGSLNNVAKRFFNILSKSNHKYFLRISADSPFIDTKILKKMIKFSNSKDYDVITNIMIRSFPKGQSVEILKTKVFVKYYNLFNTYEREHVTPFFYKNKTKFKIYNFKSKNNLSNINMSVDTKKDFEKLKKITSLFGNKNLKELKLKNLLQYYH